MPSCPSCSALLGVSATACAACGAKLSASTALANAHNALPARRIPRLLPRGTATRLAVSAMIPALAGLLVREGMRYWLERQSRETRLYRMRGSVVRQANGQVETLLFDTEILGRRDKR